MKTNTFNRTRTFGVEIEFTTASREEVACIMNGYGVNCKVEGYGHTDRTYWKIVTDSSCGNELVSPPMCGDEGLRQIEIACKSLAEAGAKVNIRCGLHVHHDANDLDVRSFANIFALYIKLENLIDTLVPQSRRCNNNTFCNSLALTPAEKQAKLDELKKVKTIEEISNRIYRSRYMKVNAQSYMRHGTIEFRQHSGTTDFEKIKNWVMLTQRIVERAKEGSVQYTYPTGTQANKQFLKLQKALRIITAQGADAEMMKMNQYYVNRAKQLRKAA